MKRQTLNSIFDPRPKRNDAHHEKQIHKNEMAGDEERERHQGRKQI